MLFFMCLFLEILWAKKCRYLSGVNIPRHSEYFPHVKNLELLFVITHVQVAFVDKIIRRNIKCNLFHQFVVKTGTYLPQKGKVRENNECRKGRKGTRYFRGNFSFSANIFLY